MLIASLYFLGPSHLGVFLQREKACSGEVFAPLNRDSGKTHSFNAGNSTVHSAASFLAEIEEEHRLGHLIIPRLRWQVNETISVDERCARISHHDTIGEDFKGQGHAVDIETLVQNHVCSQFPNGHFRIRVPIFALRMQNIFRLLKQAHHVFDDLVQGYGISLIKEGLCRNI